MGTVPVCFLIVMALLTVSLPRNRAIAPLLMTSVLMTIGPELMIGPAKFTVMRMVLVVALLRVFAKGESSDFVAGPIDRAIFWWTLVTVAMWLLPMPRHPNAVMPVRTFGEQLMMSGRFLIEITGMYFVARCWIRNQADIQFATRVLIILAVVLGGFMTVEKVTGRNLMAALGGVPEFTSMREGRLRCQGSFSHPIHAGIFGAVLTPLCMGIWLYGQRKLAVIGIAASTLMVIASASSGPLMAWVSGVAAFVLWAVRQRMQLIRRLLVLVLVVAELGMKGHVWWLIAKISDIVGGGGYWRANLIDQFVNHFSEWWLQGTSYTAHWSPTGSGQPEYPDHMDLTNQFVAEGVNGGLPKLILFVVVIVACFKRAGRIARDSSADRQTQVIFWSLGCMLAAYCVAFIAVANSSQNSVTFLWMTAALALVPKKLSLPVEPANTNQAKPASAEGPFPSQACGTPA